MFLLLPAYPGCPGQTAVKWLLLLLLMFLNDEVVGWFLSVFLSEARYRLFASANATAIPKPHRLLPH